MRTRIRGLLGPLDPMRDEPAVEPPPPPARPAFEPARPVVGRWLLAGAAVVVVVVGLVVWQSVGPSAPRGVAATPRPLVITAPAVPTPAGQRLAELAERARASGVPEAGGGTEYLEMRAWYLNSQTSGGSTVSAVVPEVHRTWRSEDGSGRTEVEFAEPEFRDEADRGTWASPLGGIESSEWQAGGREFAFTGRPPTTAAGLAEYLYRPNPPDRVGPIKALEAVNDLVRERVLTSAERGAVLDLLASLPGMTHRGATTDRVGRAAEAFSLDSAYGGLPGRYTILVSPDAGVILGNEEMLTTTAGALNVSIPAVIEYETYVRAEFR